MSGVTVIVTLIFHQLTKNKIMKPNFVYIVKEET